MSINLLRLLMILCLVSFAAGCPSVWTQEKAAKEPSAEELYKEAEESVNKKRFNEATLAYQRLLSAYPEFDKTAEVHVKLGDAFYSEGEYEKAIARYLQFMKLYPSHPHVPRVKYYLAMSHFNQIKSSDLDDAVLRKSSESFRTLASDTKGGEWAKKAEEKYQECRKKLAEKEIYKARTYISLRNYRGAKLAAKRVLDEYSKLGFDEEANQILDKAKDR